MCDSIAEGGGDWKLEIGRLRDWRKGEKEGEGDFTIHNSYFGIHLCLASVDPY
jgi:hypothetical protein